MFSRLLALGFCLLLLVAPNVKAVSAAQYTIVDLGSLGGTRNLPQSINDKGQVVGVSFLASNSVNHAFLWNGCMQDLGVLPGGVYSSASGINSGGQIVGISGSPSGYHGCVWQSTTLTDLPSASFPYSSAEALGINSSGQVVGDCWSPSEHQACLWENSGITTLQGLGGSYSISTSINGNGQIAGYSTVQSGAYHACIWQGGAVTDLGPGYAFDINDNGQIIGLSIAQGGGYWQGSTFTPLVGLDTSYKYADPVAANNNGIIVGYARYSTSMATYSRACLWQNGAITELPSLPGWLRGYSQALDVNNNGQIIGYAYDSNNVEHAVLWTPVPEPSGLPALFIALASTGVAYRRRRRV